MAAIPIFAYGLALIYEVRFALIWGIPLGWVRVTPTAMIIPIYSILAVGVVFWAWMVGSVVGSVRSKSPKLRIAWMAGSATLPFAFVALVILALGYNTMGLIGLGVALGWPIYVLCQGDPKHWDEDDEESMLDPKIIQLLLLPIDSLSRLGIPMPRVSATVMVLGAVIMFVAGEYAAKNAYQRHVVQIEGADYLVLRSYQEGMVVAPFDVKSGIVTNREVRFLQADQVANQPIRSVRLKRPLLM